MEVQTKTFASHHHRLPDDDVTMTSHRHHNHRHHQQQQRPLLWSSLLRSMVSPIVCLLLLVNPVLLQSPRNRSQFNFRHNFQSNARRTNASSLHLWTPASDVAPHGRAWTGGRFMAPTTDPTETPATGRSTTTRRPTLRKILEGDDDEDHVTTRRRTTEIRPTRETLVLQQLMPIVARIRLESVSSDEFRRRLRMARSYRDVVRIFIRSEERLRDEDIDDFIASPLMAHTGNHGNAGAQSMIVGSSGRQSIEDNRLPTNEWQMAMNHYQEMESIGQCRLPVPKFIQVRHHDQARTDSDYLPECTVVYRCHKEYGCCNSTSECGVKTSTYVYRSFYELTCPPNANCSEYPIPAVRTFQFVNHTECECKPIKHLPRCLLCPVPFEMGGREEFGRCNCTCDNQHQQCLQISNGSIPLPADQVNCVRESTCERPFCVNGEYDVNTGFCPCPEDSPDCRTDDQGQEDEDDDDDDDDDEEEDDDNDDYATAETTQTTNNEQPTTQEATNTSNHDQQ